jgi:hypothetical protein
MVAMAAIIMAGLIALGFLFKPLEMARRPLRDSTAVNASRGATGSAHGRVPESKGGTGVPSSASHAARKRNPTSNAGPFSCLPVDPMRPGLLHVRLGRVVARPQLTVQERSRIV